MNLTLHPVTKRILLIGGSVVTLIVIGVIIKTTADQQPPRIITNTLTSVSKDGRVTGGTHPSHQLRADTEEPVTFESAHVDVPTRVNAAVLQWDQDGTNGVEAEVRTFNGDSWSPWTEAEPVDGGKDGVDIKKSSTLVLANVIKKIQFRYTLNGSKAAPSATINADSSSLMTIDSHDGPGSTESIYQKLKRFLGISGIAGARADSPPIITRAEWGSPEPDHSAWPPEYHPLARAIVHHTATTETPDSYATVRAIWHYHAITLGWGDIGYSYLVDSAGRVFQGRYFDKNYAEQNRTDVIAGHAYGNNTGTTGIAAIGNLAEGSIASGAQKNAISYMIGYKLSPYDINPSGNGGYGAAVIGHRDVYPTACPGSLYGELDEIRATASSYYMRYNAYDKLDYHFFSQQLYKDGQPINQDTVLKPFDDVEISFALKNAGFEAWRNFEPYKTVLGTSNPQDRSTGIYTGSWLQPNRAASFSAKKDPSTGVETPATTISAGEIGVFRFPIKVPDLLTSGAISSSVQKEYFRIVQDGRIWFPRDIGLYSPLRVERHRYDWSYVSQALYTDETMATPATLPLSTDTRYFANLTIKNTGNASWHMQNVRLGTSHSQNRTSVVRDATWLSNNRPGTFTQNSIEPNEQATFTFWIRTPPTAYSGKEYFQPVVDGVTWMNDIGLYWNIQSQ
jgi:hypothetical protein